jgi:signal transduction histidine kinase
VALMAFLGGTLLASVIIPALETRRVLRLLRETTEVIEPARVLSTRLESGLALEYSALQGYALSGDTALLGRYEAMATQEARDLASLERLVGRLGPEALAHAAHVRSRITEWQALNGALFGGGLTRAQFADAARAQRALRDSIISEIDRMPSELASEAAVRAEEVRDHEWRGLLANAALVVVALAAMAAVVVLSLRERRLSVMLERRATYEIALRETGEALAGAFTMADVAGQLARSALDATKARGVCVENVEAGPDGTLAVVVRGAAGSCVPAAGETIAYRGSYAEQAIAVGAPTSISDLKAIARPDPDWMATVAVGATIVLPLGQASAPVGALFIVGADSKLFDADTAWAHTFSHLATLAYEKVRLLDEAREGRLALERLMRSRQRLMRGFSHDVKNPLGAADGYADLLSAGIYGALTPKQSECVQRIRASIHRALDLIDDLHELARAETGNIALRRQVIDPGEMARTAADEYRGAAEAGGLPLTVDLPPDLPAIETDGGRVRQIIGNLLSNAIKYTRTGSIVLRVRDYPFEEIGPTTGWVHFDVIDTGIGIPPDKRETIFEEFSRLGGNDRAGAGLGLAISKRLAEALGGEILVESDLGHGSMFTLRLPVRPPETWSAPSDSRSSATAVRA